MGKTLFGGERSGTPVETREGTSQMAALLQAMMQGGPEGVAEPFGRMTSDAWINMLGFDPTEMGLGDAAKASIMDPRDATAGLFASLKPFEERTVAENVAGQRQMFGALGGRFGRNIAAGESQLRGELANQFMRSREEALLSANAQRNAALMNIMAASLGARGQAFQESFAPWQSAMGFLQPGAPVIQEGMLPGMVGAGLNLFGMMKLMGQNPGIGGGGGQTAFNVPAFSGPSRTPPPGGVPWGPWTMG